MDVENAVGIVVFYPVEVVACPVAVTAPACPYTAGRGIVSCVELACCRSGDFSAVIDDDDRAARPVLPGENFVHFGGVTACERLAVGMARAGGSFGGEALPGVEVHDGENGTDGDNILRGVPPVKIFAVLRAGGRCYGNMVDGDGECLTGIDGGGFCQRVCFQKLTHGDAVVVGNVPIGIT